jgi:hypothetical protein
MSGGDGGEGNEEDSLELHVDGWFLSIVVRNVK